MTTKLNLFCAIFSLLLKNIESVYLYHQTHQQNHRKLLFHNWNSSATEVYEDSKCHVTAETGSVYPINDDDGNKEIGRLQYATRIQGNRMSIGAVELCISDELAAFEPSYEQLIPLTVSWQQLRADPIIEDDEYSFQPSTVPTSILNTPPTAIEQATSIPTEVADSNQLLTPSPSSTLLDETEESDSIETEDAYVSTTLPILSTASPSSQEEAEINDLMDQMKDLLGFGVKETPSFPPTTAESTIVPSLMPSNVTTPVTKPALVKVKVIEDQEPEEEETAYYESPAVIAGGAAATAAVGGTAFLAKGAIDGTGVLANLLNNPPGNLLNTPPDAPDIEMNNDKKGKNKNEKKSNEKKENNNKDDDKSKFEFEWSDDSDNDDEEEEEERPILVRQRSYRNVVTKKKKKSNKSIDAVSNTEARSLSDDGESSIPEQQQQATNALPRSPPENTESPTHDATNDATGPSTPSGYSFDDGDCDNVSVISEPNVHDLSYFLNMGFLDVNPGGSDHNADDMV